jgi:hypothetical protein
VKVDVEDHQRRIREQQRKKDEKIRLAQLEKEQKELEECSFAPNTKSKKPKKKSNTKIQSSINGNMNDNSNSGVNADQYGESDDEQEVVRPID